MTDLAIADLVMAMSCLPHAADAPGTKIDTRFLVAALRSLNPTDEELAELTRRASLRFKFRPVPAELAELLREIRAERPEPIWYETTAPGVAGQPPTVRILKGDEAVAAKAAHDREQAAQALPSPEEVDAARERFRAAMRARWGDEVSA